MTPDEQQRDNRHDDEHANHLRHVPAHARAQQPGYHDRAAGDHLDEKIPWLSRREDHRQEQIAQQEQNEDSARQQWG